MAKSKEVQAVSLYNYQATIIDWLDGDTCDVMIDLGFSLALKERVRIHGINCPETKSKNAAEKSAGHFAKTYAGVLAPEGSMVSLKSIKNRSEEKYGRFLADITLKDGRSFAQTMIENKHALPWDGKGTRPI